MGKLMHMCGVFVVFLEHKICMCSRFSHFKNKHRSSISDSTDSELLKFGLFKCTDVPAAFEAAAHIITDYASGKETVSKVGLENAKSSLSYGIISGMSTKL